MVTVLVHTDILNLKFVQYLQSDMDLIGTIAENDDVPDLSEPSSSEDEACHCVSYTRVIYSTK